MKILSLIVLFGLTGCGFYRTTDITITGTDIKSPYGTGNGNIVYHSNWGFANGTNPRPTVTTAK